MNLAITLPMPHDATAVPAAAIPSGEPAAASCRWREGAMPGAYGPAPA